MANNKKTIKKDNKKSIDSNNSSEDAKSLIKIIIGVVLFFGIGYLLILLLGSLGMFEKGYTKPTTETEKIEYDKAIIGTVFNRPESEYYVVFDKFTDSKNIYLDYILSSAKSELNIYKVDMSLGINSDYSGETGNYNAQSSNELVINGPTLIKIRNGKNILYLENLEEIEEELNK